LVQYLLLLAFHSIQAHINCDAPFPTLGFVSPHFLPRCLNRLIYRLGRYYLFSADVFIDLGLPFDDDLQLI